MADPKPPFYVSFTHDWPPPQVDHSNSYPGPPGGSFNRAGFASVTSRARLTVAWYDGFVETDGSFPIFAQAVSVYFRLTDFLIAITSDYAVGSCAYKASLRHELEAHIHDPIYIFHFYRDVLIKRLNGIAVPTRGVPLRVASTDEAASRKAEVEHQIVNVISRTRRELAQELRAARDRHDDAASYRLVHNQCSDTEWASGR